MKKNFLAKPNYNKLLRQQQEDHKARREIMQKIKHDETAFINEINFLIDQHFFK